MLLVISGCATNPATLEKDFFLMSEAEEIELGKTYHQQFLAQNHVYNDSRVQNYVNAIGQNIATLSHRSNLDYQITVIDSPELNAYASPGGYIYVTRGMLAYLNSEAELAAVLAHEVGHVAARHAARKDAALKIPNFLGKALFNHIGFGIDKTFNQLVNTRSQRYSQEFELEADRLAVEYLARSGYSPQAMSRVINTVKNNEQLVQKLVSVSTPEANLYHGFNTHPDSLKRKTLVDKDVHRLVEELSTERNPNQEDYLNRIKGLVYGPAAKGQVVGERFLHAASRTGLHIPNGWHVNGDGKILRMVSPGEEAAIQVLIKPHITGVSAKTHLRQLLISDELSNEVKLEGEDIEGWMANSTKQTAEGEIPIWLATWIVDDVVQVVVATATNREKYSPVIEACIRSFHKLGDSDLQLIQPRRIDLLKTKPGVTYDWLATESALGEFAEQQLRLINGQTDPGEELEADRWIKIVR